MINCLIVDDAPVAREILIGYCKLLPILQVVGTCSNAFEAREKMQQVRIDLLLLDIDMPLLSGIDLIRTLKNAPEVIFTTAYKEHAAHAFDLAATDYLVKPFSLERFIVAIDKAIEKIGKQKIAAPTELPQEQDTHLFIRTEGAIHKLDFDCILFLEASRNNTKVVSAEKILLSSTHLSAIEKLLPSNLFFRVHRSFIINRSKITSLRGNRVFVGKNEIPLGSNYKNGFLQILGLS